MPQRARREHLQSDGGGEGVGGKHQLLLKGERERKRVTEGGWGIGWEGNDKETSGRMRAWKEGRTEDKACHSTFPFRPHHGLCCSAPRGERQRQQGRVMRKCKHVGRRYCQASCTPPLNHCICLPSLVARRGIDCRPSGTTTSGRHRTRVQCRQVLGTQ